jgi:phosphatidylglycerophosphatase C
VRRVRQAFDLAGFEAIHAYDDSKGDRPMLAMATHRSYRWRGL